jgi:hypothetical protein
MVKENKVSLMKWLHLCNTDSAIIMKITRERIEALGFTLRVMDEETGDDCSYNIPSNKIGGWWYLIVHHPSKDEVCITHHASSIQTYGDIKRVAKGKMKTMKELTEVLKKYNII